MIIRPGWQNPSYTIFIYIYTMTTCFGDVKKLFSAQVCVELISKWPCSAQNM